MVFIAHVRHHDDTVGDTVTKRIIVMADDFESAVRQIEGYYENDLMGLDIDFLNEVNFVFLTESAEAEIKNCGDNYI